MINEYEIGVVILNYNNYNLTSNTVDILKTFNKEINIIIVDNCSTNDSYKVLFDLYKNDNYIHTIINKVNAGYAAGNNFGVRYIINNLPQVKYLFIMNPDVVVNSYYTFEKLCEILNENENLGALTVNTIFNHKIRNINESSWNFPTKKDLLFGTSLFKSKKVKYRYYSLTDYNYYYSDVVQGCFFAIKTCDFIKCGMFDENTFLYFEEAILAKKLKKINKFNAVYPFISINHNHQCKNESLLNYKNKIFDVKCFYQSKKYYVQKYSNYSYLFKFICLNLLSIEYYLKKIYLKMKLRK